MSKGKITEITKTCFTCKKPKPLAEFYNMKGQPDGLDHYCKECRKRKSRRWSRTNKEYRKERDARRWKKANKEIESAKRRERYKKKKRKSRAKHEKQDSRNN